MTAGEESKNWVEAYASDLDMSHTDIAQAMAKFSNLQVLVAPMGIVRGNCRNWTENVALQIQLLVLSQLFLFLLEPSRCYYALTVCCL